MHSNCILDSVADLLVHHMVFVGNVQTSPIASSLKVLDSSFEFCCQGPALTGMNACWWISFTLTLEASGKHTNFFA